MFDEKKIFSVGGEAFDLHAISMGSITEVMKKKFLGIINDDRVRDVITLC